MASEKPVYSMVRGSGRAETLRDVVTYLEALSAIWRDIASAGSSHDSPKLLLRNGEIVVFEDLTGRAYNHQKAQQEEWEQARRRVEQRCVESFAEEYAVG